MGFETRYLVFVARGLFMGATVFAGSSCFAQYPAAGIGVYGDCCNSGDSTAKCWTPGFAGQGFAPLGSFSACGFTAANPTAKYSRTDTGCYSHIPNRQVESACGMAANSFNTHCIAPGVGAVSADFNCEMPPIRRWYVGFEFLWMRAHFDQNVAMIIDPPIGNRLVPFNYDFQLAPRTWLGWQGCNGGGLRVTYWQFNDNAATERATAVAGATPVYLFVYGAGGNLTRNAYADLGETLISDHSLALQALDLEATQRFDLGALQCMAGAGIRLADLDQNLRGEVYDATNSLWEIVTNDLNFQGAGPTLSLQAFRPISTSRLSMFGGLRGAMLYSETRQAIYEMKDGYANELVDVADAHEVLSMGEMSIGLQYMQPLGSRSQFFARGSYEGQAWFDVGGPVDSHSTVALDGLGFAIGLLY